MTTVAVLGATGSIGSQTADVVRAEPDRFDITALAAWSSVDQLIEQAKEFRPDAVAIGESGLANRLKAGVPAGIEVLVGEAGFEELATRADVIVNGVVGFAGLGVTLAALSSGRRLALANKESLIAAGPLVRPLRLVPGAELIPVDSEHCALHQCLRADNDVDAPRHLEKLLLTASGGPFRGRNSADLKEVTVEQALEHPTWSMGPKITVDSSTLMNKGLEVIEAHELFDVPYAKIEVVVHPESIVHSMATFTDGATIAQLSEPDMRLPIGYALAYPDRIRTPFGAIDWSETKSLHFEPPDRETFRCLDLAYEAGRIGGTAPAWMNGANEAAVEAFLSGTISWSEIAPSIERALELHDGATADSVDAIVRADRRGRECVQSKSTHGGSGV
ncbi:MAG TPA: 1-deoxy-D-xylulose-5-phosphate reductoisomerase [Acidimicrobiia bacterium]|nr:1-deoxy-D-xylulose-5-phosphate reductoisomerase [Acidimicrobiia bacterium]HIL06242.1 1-deoxy-D-xylulose-5-phosphate reductoisomerase [Acidimicrobiia bacterium]